MNSELDLENIDTSGFYSKDAMLRAGKFVFGPGFTLQREEKDNYTYPFNGWHWFESATEAAASFDVDIDELNLDLPSVNV